MSTGGTLKNKVNLTCLWLPGSTQWAQHTAYNYRRIVCSKREVYRVSFIVPVWFQKGHRSSLLFTLVRVNNNETHTSQTFSYPVYTTTSIEVIVITLLKVKKQDIQRMNSCQQAHGKKSRKQAAGCFYYYTTLPPSGQASKLWVQAQAAGVNFWSKALEMVVTGDLLRDYAFKTLLELSETAKILFVHPYTDIPRSVLLY